MNDSEHLRQSDEAARHTPQQIDILRHALGLNRDDSRFEYRNHFCTGPGSTDWNDCEQLVGAGLMTKSEGNVLTGGDFVFRCTVAGIAVARGAIAKATRSAS